MLVTSAFGGRYDWYSNLYQALSTALNRRVGRASKRLPIPPGEFQGDLLRCINADFITVHTLISNMA